MSVHKVRFYRYSQPSNQLCTLLHSRFSGYRNLELEHYGQTLIGWFTKCSSLRDFVGQIYVISGKRIE